MMREPINNPQDSNEPPNLPTRREVLVAGLAGSVVVAAGYPVFALSGSPNQTAGAGITSRDALIKIFKAPPLEYATIDNWWWEAGRLERGKITWQLQELKDKGSAGTWFYPRWVHGESLTSDPPYWTEKWWDLMRFSTEEHKRL